MLRRSVFGLAASTPCKGRPLTARLLLTAGMAWHGALRVLLAMLGPNVIPYDWIY
jgi:hypothetical protein